MKKQILIYILIVLNLFIVTGCGKDNTDSLGTTMDFRIEINNSDNLVETITIDFATRNYKSATELNDDRVLVLGYLTEDAQNHLHDFNTIVEKSTTLSDEIKEEYKHNVIEYEPKYINNTYSIEFEMVYKNSLIRQMWYHFVQTSEVLSYKDERFTETTTSDQDMFVLKKEGTWFNKSYIRTTSVYEYAFIPYPSFKTNFVDLRDDVTYTQTLITNYDELKTNAISEKLYDGNIVKRTWLVDLDQALSSNPYDGQVIEYYILQANKVSWYILALVISVMFVMFLFVIALIKHINKKRTKVN